MRAATSDRIFCRGSRINERHLASLPDRSASSLPVADVCYSDHGSFPSTFPPAPHQRDTCVQHHLLCALLAVAFAIRGFAQTGDQYAPFHADGASGTTIAVDVGSPREAAALLQRATVLTPSGTVRAELVRTERVCISPCGDDEEECHFVAILRAAARVERAVAVLAGSPNVRQIAPMPSGPERRIDNPAFWIDAEPIRDEQAVYRWMRFPDGVFLTLEGMGRDMYAPPIDLASCSIRPAAPFSILSCGGAELLYEGSRGIALSFADYSVPTIQPVLRFRLNGRDAVVIRLGLKADVTTALLLKGDDGQWRLTFRTLDYALLC